jgi:hypothetical protein
MSKGLHLVAAAVDVDDDGNDDNYKHPPPLQAALSGNK